MYPRNIREALTFQFSAEEEGLYAVGVSARCRSGAQFGRYGGEDLRVEIDGMKLREEPPTARAQFFNVPPAWNGTKLQGLAKTVIFVLRLSAGEHKLVFVPYRGAEILEEPRIKKIGDLRNFTAVKEVTAEEGDRRPWITIALLDLPIKSLAVDASARWRFSDSEDLGLIVDGIVKKNYASLLRRNWLWAGSLYKKVTGRERTQHVFTEDWPSGVHYIEFLADRTPTIHSATLDFGPASDEKLQGTVTDPGEGVREVNLRFKPSNSSDSEVVKLLPIGEQVVILKERVEGEYVKAHSNIWHRAQHEGEEGYILSSYVDINGKTTEDIKSIIRAEAEKLNLDPDMALSLAHCESGFKPYAVSESNAKGVMQITDLLMKDLNDPAKVFYSPVDDPFDVEQNIKAGLAYFAHILGLYASDNQRLAKAVAAYNAGPGNVPANEPLDLSKYEFQVGRLVECVQGGLSSNFSRTGKQLALAALCIGLGLAGLGGWFVNSSHEGNVLGDRSNGPIIKGPFAYSFENPFYAVPRIKSIQVSERELEPMFNETIVTVETFDGRVSKQSFSGSPSNAFLFRIDFDDLPELILERREGQLIRTNILYFNEDTDALVPASFIDKDGKRKDNLCCGSLIFKSRSNGVEYDVAMHTPRYGDNLTSPLGIEEVVYSFDSVQRYSLFEKDSIFIPLPKGG